MVDGQDESKWSIQPSPLISQSRCFKWRSRTNQAEWMKNGGAEIPEDPLDDRGLLDERCVAGRLRSRLPGPPEWIS